MYVINNQMFITYSPDPNYHSIVSQHTHGTITSIYE